MQYKKEAGQVGRFPTANYVREVGTSVMNISPTLKS